MAWQNYVTLIFLPITDDIDNSAVASPWLAGQIIDVYDHIFCLTLIGWLMLMTTVLLIAHFDWLIDWKNCHTKGGREEIIGAVIADWLPSCDMG